MKGLISVGPLMLQRLLANWRLLLVLAFGILVAATLLAVSPVYTRVMNDLGLQEALERQIGSAGRNALITTGNRLGDPAFGPRQQELAQLMSTELGWFTDHEVRYGAVSFMRLASDDLTVQDGTLLSITTITGIEEHVNLVAGRLPEPTSNPANIEVLIPYEAAVFLGAQPGDRVRGGRVVDNCNRPPPTDDPEQAREQAIFRCTPQIFADLRAELTIAGIVERIDASDRYWSSGHISFNRPIATDEQGPIVPVILPEQSFFQALPGALPGFRYEYRITGFADITRLDSANIRDASASLASLRTRAAQVDAIPDLAMAAPLSSFQDRASFNQISLLLLLLQVVGIAIYFVVLVSSLLAERRSEEIAMLRSRGASVAQLVAMSTAEAFAIGLVAALLAPFVAAFAVSALGLTGTFASISGGGMLPFTVVPVAFLFALGGALIAAVATVIPAFFAARRGMVLFLRSAARPEKPLLQRYYLDLGLVGLSGLALWQLSQRGSVFDARSVGGWSADPLLLLSPLLMILAVGALMFRFLPLVLGFVTRLMARTSGPGVTLGLWQLTRSPARYTQLALLIVMAAAVGTFAATYGETTDRSQEERALYAVGTDVRLTGLGRLGNDFGAAVQRLEEIDGVDRAVTAIRTGYNIGPLPTFGARVNILGIDPQRAADLLWFRDDFAEQDLPTVLRQIRGSPVMQQGLVLPGEPRAISLWVNPLEARIATTLWVRTQDANGIFRLHELGRLDFVGYQHLEAQIDAPRDGIVFPIAIVGIIMTQAETISDPARHVIFDDLAITTETGEQLMIDDFDGSLRWEVIATATRNRDEIGQVGQDQVHSGTGAVRFSFLTGTNAPMRGLYVRDPNIPLPAIASRHFVNVTGLRTGGQIELVIGRVLVPITITGVVDYFPTMYDSGAGFLILNQEHLYYYAGLINDSSSNRPTEAWLTLSGDSEARTAAKTALLDRFGIPSGQVIDTQTILEDIRTDPVVRAGGSGVLLLALVAAFAILALGFALTLYLGGQSRTIEVAVMRAVGISPRQLFTMISLEYLLIAVIGLIIGTVAGLRISELMLGFLNVTEGGGRVIPPFELVTRWDTVGIAFLAVGASFLVGVIALGVYFLRLPVSRVIRITR